MLSFGNPSELLHFRSDPPLNSYMLSFGSPSELLHVLLRKPL